MVMISDEVDINLPAERIYSFGIDPRNELHYNESLLSAEKITDGPVTVGSRFACEHKQMGHMDIEIARDEAPRRYAMRMSGKMGSGTYTATLTPRGSGTHFEGTMEFQPKGLMKIMSFMAKPMMKKEMRHTHASLKSYLEAQRDAGTGS